MPILCTSFPVLNMLDTIQEKAFFVTIFQVPGQSTDSVSGPGTYKLPTTTYFDHPAEKMPGRTKFGKAPRFKYVDIEDQ